MKLSDIDAFTLRIFYAPVAEEVFFRMLLQEHFGIWIASILFVLAHKWRFHPFAFIGFAMSVAAGYIYQDFGLWYAIGFHSLLNFIQWLRSK